MHARALLLSVMVLLVLTAPAAIGLSWRELASGRKVPGRPKPSRRRGALSRDSLPACDEACLRRAAKFFVAPGETTVIGKLKDLENLGPGENTLLDRLPNQGSPKLNWQQNSGVLRSEMGKGLPIRDASVDGAGNLSDNTGFLRAERNLLQDRGWTYNPATRTWSPPAPGR